MCGADNPPLRNSLRYSSINGPLIPVGIENGELRPSYPTALSDAYNYEGSRKNGSKCSFCPYHQYPDEFGPEWYLLGNIRNLPTPMYGPCFNGQKSAKINCVQNLLFYPPEFAGEYFYPDQKGDLAVSAGEAFPVHIFLTGTSNLLSDGTPKAPTDYGLGKRRVLENIGSLIVKYAVSGEIDQNTTLKLQEPFLTDKNGNERWLFWAQYYCTPGCHKNSQQRYVTVRPEDYQNKSQTLYYLSRKTTAVGGTLSMYQCKECQPYHASYMWYFDSGNNNEFPGLVKRNPFASQCFPWFGSIPALILSAQDPAFNTTVTAHSVGLDGVINPTQTTHIVSKPCASGTFNDVCAHTLKYLHQGLSTQAQCKPCAAGYHTDGKEGSWYCLPPLGMMMSNWAMLMKISNSNNQSLIWSRRDILGYEFECGYLSSHCTQCSAATNTLGFLPDAFNQAMILKPILAVVLCPSSYFCPSSMQAPLQCPSDFPWSPPGSWDISNCTCARGKYLSISGNCVACNSNAACNAGFYMAGWRMCMQRDGATNGGICTPCGNKPPNAIYSTGAGIEVGPFSAYFGVCPFKCPIGHNMNTVIGSSDCLNTHTCTPVGQLINAGGVAVYSSTLTSKQDEYTAKMSETGAFVCADNKVFTIETYRALSASSNWPRISTSCLESNSAQCATTACEVFDDSSYDHDVRCSPCRGVPSDGSYSSAANSGYTTLASRSSMCSIQCSAGLYINMTSYTCMSCLALDAAVCPAEYKIRGQGCLGIYDLFSTTNISSNCIRCSISLAEVGTGFYVDLQGTNGCERKPCPVVNLGNSRYRKEACSGFSLGVVEDCTQVCGPNQFLSGSCTEFATGVCKNCTNFNPGYYIPPSGTCSHLGTDTLWRICGTNMGFGFYCPGSGESVMCPNGKTSMPGARSMSDCYCPAGTKNDGIGGCYNYQCPDSQVSFLAPGIGFTSKSYMALDSTMETACYPCSTLSYNSISFTMGGVGFDSCTCPREMYGLVVDGGNLSCINCPTTATTCGSGSGYNIPSTCWRGNSIGGPSVCQCALPPFTMKSPIGCQIQQCILNFEPLVTINSGVSGLPLKEISSGSAMYINRPTTSGGGWNARYFAIPNSVYDYTIARMIVTSDLTESSSETNLQYVLWTIKDPNFENIIWTAPLPPMTRYKEYNPYSTNPNPWVFECSVSSESKTLEDIAISKWPYTFSTGQYFERNIAAPKALVAAVVKQGQRRFLYLKTASINFITQDVLWGPEVDNCGIGVRSPIAFEVPANSSVVSTTHAYAYPSLPLSVSSSAFYMGYNTEIGGCGIVAVRVDGALLTLQETLTLDLTSVSKRQITAMAVLAAPSNGVWLYLSFHNVADTLKLIKWSSSTGVTNIESDEIFKGGWSRVISLSILWPQDSIFPIFMALVKNDTTGKTSVITADGIQRTFTEVQGMPVSTSPSTVRGLEVGLNKGLIVASGGGTIFSIAMQRCPQISVNGRIVPRFWDGESCISHTCMRPRTCSIEGVGQTYDNNEMRCVCSPGYYKTSVGLSSLTCVLCSSNSYCANNTIFTCPTNMISTIGSKIAEDCTCQEGYYFTGVTCLQCPSGKWCPNKWNAYSCLGGFETAQTQTGSIYPTLCTCSVGFIGPNCDPCSSGKYCSKGALSVSSVTNVPIRLTVNLHANMFSSFSVGSTEEMACGGVKNALVQLFSSSGVWYLRQLDTLERRFLCKYIPPSPRSKSMLIIVLQIENGDSSSLSYMVDSLTYNTSMISSMMDVNLVEPFQIATYTVINNTENVCPVGKVPTEDRGSCYCAPGYRSSYQLCVGCLSGYYKKLAGPGECIQCPAGTTSKSLASACYSTSSTENSTNVDGSSSGSGDGNLPIIVGGVVGGVVLTAILIFGLVKALYPSSE